jgi:putative addiction module killer protein
VEAQPRELRVYESPSGTHPYEDWLNGLRDTKSRGRIRVNVARLADGNFSNCEPVGDNVHELKMDFGPGYRVYFGEDGQNLIILLIGGDKKSQSRDIRIAKEFWQEYKESAL